MYSNFARLCSERGISIRQACLQAGVPISTVSDWKNGRQMRNDKIKKFADFFGVSVEYLMTGKEKSPSTEEEDIDAALIEMLKKLDPSQVQRVKDFVAGIQAK